MRQAIAVVAVVLVLGIVARAHAGCPVPIPTGSGTCTDPFVIPNTCLYTPDANHRDMKGTIRGTTLSGGFKSVNAGSCDHGALPSPEVVYKWTAPVDGKLIVTSCGESPSTAAVVDTVLYMRMTDCLTGDECACNDDSTVKGLTRPMGCSTIEAPVANGVDYFVFVDGYNGAVGTYTLTARFEVGNNVYTPTTTTTTTTSTTTTT